ncbi:MAG: sulfite dehydrogenase [Herminiimonas sp.]|nr:sulfite dehydrogenase [Herminiimonas sp.]
MANDRSRRNFLRGSLAAGSALLARQVGAAEPATVSAPMLPARQSFTPYGQPVRHERAVVRRIAANRDVAGNGVGLTPLEDLEGTITPSGLHFERHHNGVPAIDPVLHDVMLHGLVRQPLAFGIAQLRRYPMHSKTLVIECSGNSNVAWHREPMQRPVGSMHGLVSCSEWTGVPLALLLDEAGVDPKATWAVVEGADGFNFSISIPLSKIRDDCFLALYQNGERLRAEQGYPVRLMVPGWRGHLHVKWVRRIELTDTPRLSRNETAAYSALMPDGRERIFDFVLDVKSVITTPTHGQTLPAPGLTMISGLAWSGHGAIRSVDVSVDGGKSWQPATLQQPLLAQAFARFSFAWNRNGRPAILQSRATDDSGRVQPSRAALLAARGHNNFYHFNGIVSWEVDEDGSVSHVYA